MTPFLNPLKESIWLRVTLLAFGAGALGVLMWVLVTDVLQQNMALAAVFSAGTVISFAVICGKVLTNYAFRPTDFLARSIMLVTEASSHINAPDPNTLGVNREFLASLAQNVYGLVGSTKIVPVNDKQAEQQASLYHAIASSIPLPVVVLNNQQVVTFINDAGLKYLEISPDDTAGRPLFEVANLAFSGLTLEDWIVDRSANSVVGSEVWERVRLNLPDDRRKQFDLAAHYSNNDSQGVETTLVIIDKTLVYERDDHDFTFVSLAVHELRTPLTIMRGYIEVFEDELSPTLSAEQVTFMHNMSASAEQLTSFVSNILNVARVEENALYLSLGEENWPEVLKVACQDMELRAKVHNKHLVYDIADNLPTVAIDKVSIYEVIANLIDNAIKYTHTDEDIVIKTYLKDNMIETTVTDKGVGIAENMLGHIFDKFFRAHNSKNSVGGTGLGLYLCRAIINAHNGNIWVHSHEGKGSTFGFSLPLYANVADQIKNEHNNNIVRGAHGWIKNHSFYKE